MYPIVANDSEGAILSDQVEEFIGAINAVEEEYEADVYLYSASIDHNGAGHLIDAYPLGSNRKKALLIISTTGGLANAAFQIARFFHNNYEEFILFIPFSCKSAGTLVAVGAHRLIMGPFSELGPLDVQLIERDEVFSRRSGLLSHSTFEALKQESFSLYEHFLMQIKVRSGDSISFPLASQVSTAFAGEVMKSVYSQISPTTIGSDYQDLRIAIEYGARLAVVGENIETAGITHLTTGYPSHDFIIDIMEARGLFRRVDDAGANLYRLLTFIGDIVVQEHHEGVVRCLSSVADAETGEEEDDSDGAEEAVVVDSEASDRAGDDSAVEDGQASSEAAGEPIGNFDESIPEEAAADDGTGPAEGRLKLTD